MCACECEYIHRMCVRMCASALFVYCVYAHLQFLAAARFQPTTSSSGVTDPLGNGFPIPARLRRHFVSVNLDTPSPASIETMFSTILAARSVAVAAMSVIAVVGRSICIRKLLSD